MGNHNQRESNCPHKFFIQIVLSLLLALAFFSTYFVKEGEISTGAILMFIFGILSLIALTIIYTEKCHRIWAYFSITPFILMILFNLTLLYYGALKIEYSGWGFFTVGIPQLFSIWGYTESIISIWVAMVLFLVILLLKKLLSRG